MSFKTVAIKILKEAGKPLHSKVITKLARDKGYLETAGKTPEATMNAVLVVDINEKKEKSPFVKVGPSIFALNQKYKEVPARNLEDIVKTPENLSTIQKGDIAEARIAELITLYGDRSLGCYKPISDDEGIDLVVKEKRKNKPTTIFIQVKSNFRKDPSSYSAEVTKNTLINSPKMVLVFCHFDLSKGDLWDFLWLVPAPIFIQKANNLQDGRYGFVAGWKKKEGGKWNAYLIEKYYLADKIAALMKETKPTTRQKLKK